MGWRDFTVPSLKVLGAATLAGALSVAGTLTGAAAAFSGTLSTTNTANATGANTGALQVAGGAYIAKDVFVGDDINMQNTQQILYRNAANSAWLDAMRVNASDILLIGSSIDELRLGSGQNFILTTTAATFSVAAYGSRVTNGLESSFTASSTVPGFSWIETDAAADNRHWQAFVNGAAWKFRALNDAGSSSSTFMQVNRTGTTVNKLEFGATEYDFQANNLGTSFATLNTNAATFSVDLVTSKSLFAGPTAGSRPGGSHFSVIKSAGTWFLDTHNGTTVASEAMSLRGSFINLSPSSVSVADIRSTHLDFYRVLREADGSASAPSYTFTSDPDTGLYRPASNTIAIGAGGGSVMQFNTIRAVVNSGKPLRISGQTGTPASPQAGDLTYNTTNKHQGYDGTSWNDLY